jgi:O-glycosyl hydrolase
MPEMTKLSEEYALEALHDPDACRVVDIIGAHAYEIGSSLRWAT